MNSLLNDLSIMNLASQDHVKYTENKPRVVYYQGTFDPVHDGHISALTAALKETKACFAIILADNENNPYKPKRSNHVMRTEMLLLAFSHLKNVFISNLPKDELKKKLIEKAYVITLIGSDVWSFYQKKENIPFQAICVSLRNQEVLKIDYFKEKEVFVVRPEISTASSTKIRKILKERPGFYEEVTPKNQIENLNSRVLEYILSKKIYYRSKEERLNKLYKKVTEKIRAYVQLHIFKGSNFHLECLTGIGKEGQSGDLTFKAHTNKDEFFIKAFVRTNHSEDLKNEVQGIELVNAMNLRWSAFKNPINWDVNQTSFSHMGQPFIEKADLSKIFKGVSAGLLESEQLIRSCFFVGRILTELHHVASYPMVPSCLEYETVKLNLRVLSCYDLIEKKDSRAVALKQIDAFNHSCEAYKKNPGVHTYAHGDANLSNFIVYPETEKVLMLDLARLSAMRTDQGQPLGFPAEDFHRFLGGLNWMNLRFPLLKEVLAKAMESFTRGYATMTSVITPEADHFFGKYWELRCLKYYHLQDVRNNTK